MVDPTQPPPGSPPVLHLRVGDPLPALDVAALDRAPAKARWRLIACVARADQGAAVGLLTAVLARHPTLDAWLLVHDGPAAPAPPLQTEGHATAAADRLGALQGPSGARASLWVLVEPRGSVQASVAGLSAAAIAAVTAPLG